MVAKKDKSPYAVTLHNVDKFEQLVNISSKGNGKMGQRDNQSAIVESSEEYLDNLKQSFNL